METVMTAATLGAEGVITLPANVIDRLTLIEGDRIEFVELHAGQFLLIPVNRSVVELKGMFGKPARQASIADMNRAIASGGAGGARKARSRQSNE